MAKIQLSAFIKKPAFILGLILISFFLRGLFLTAISPMLKGQDESRHYIAIQYLAEPVEKNWEIGSIEKKQPDGLEKYVGSQEFMETVKNANLSARPVFTDSFYGENELKILNSHWSKYIELRPASIVGGKKLYHRLAAFIENYFSDQSIFFRFYSIRIFSVVLGTLSVLFAYFLIKAVGFPAKISLIITAIMSFQPRFSIYTTNVNYDVLLILIFILFTLGSVLFLKHGANWKNMAIIILSFFLGIYTKGTTIILVGPFLFLISFFIYKKIKSGCFSYKHAILVIFIIFSAVLILLFNYNIKAVVPVVDGKISFSHFLFENLKRFEYTSDKYWGNLEEWTTTALPAYFMYAIWALEAFAIIGLIKYFALKQKIPFLPDKKYALFLIIIIFSLQFGILFHNWKMTTMDREMLLASPGRYFIPNLASHLILLFTGIGSLSSKKYFFHTVLILCLILMALFNMYVIFIAILPRYYF